MPGRVVELYCAVEPGGLKSPGQFVSLPNMSRPRSIDRLIAGVLALLYLALCTFGSLGHTHGRATPERTGRHNASSLVAASGQVGCPVCDWQASCLAAPEPAP